MDESTVLIYEDMGHELVLFKILDYLGVDMNYVKPFSKRGKDYIDHNISRYAKMKPGRIIVLRDLDNDYVCAPELKKQKLGSNQGGSNFIFRIIVKEVEAWLIADKESALNFFKLNKSVLDSVVPEDMVHPKKELLEMIRKGNLKSKEKERFYIAKPDGTLQQAYSYNAAIGEYVEMWSIDRARENAPSLDRAIKAIAASYDK